MTGQQETLSPAEAFKSVLLASVGQASAEALNAALPVLLEIARQVVGRASRRWHALWEGEAIHMVLLEGLLRAAPSLATRSDVQVHSDDDIRAYFGGALRNSCYKRYRSVMRARKLEQRLKEEASSGPAPPAFQAEAFQLAAVQAYTLQADQEEWSWLKVPVREAYEDVIGMLPADLITLRMITGVRCYFERLIPFVATHFILREPGRGGFLRSIAEMRGLWTGRATEESLVTERLNRCGYPCTPRALVHERTSLNSDHSRHRRRVWEALKHLKQAGEASDKGLLKEGSPFSQSLPEELLPRLWISVCHFWLDEGISWDRFGQLEGIQTLIQRRRSRQRKQRRKASTKPV